MRAAHGGRAALVAVVALIAACGGSDDSAPAAPAATVDGTASDEQAAAAGSATNAQSGDDATADLDPTSTTALEPIRASDVLDIDVLADAIAADADGDSQWIEVVAELRAQSWLASRYPGRYDLATIYAEPWLSTEATDPDTERVAERVWIDEPLPALVNVVERDRLGDVVQVDVTLDAGDAILRRDEDDLAIGSLPGGPSRGFFFLGQEPDGSWRIHSLMQTCLVLADEASSEEDVTC